MDALRPRPENLGDAPLVFISDVDGVYAKFDPDQPGGGNDGLGPARRRVRTSHGAKYWIAFDPDAIGELDALIHETDIELCWLTYWGPNVIPLIEQAFDGLLSGGYVLAKKPKRHRGHIPMYWKQDAIEELIVPTGTPWAWADDEAIDIAMTRDDFASGSSRGTAPHLLLPTKPTTGLTVEQIAELRAFAMAVS